MVPGFPQMALVRQHFPKTPPVDVDEVIGRGLGKLRVTAGARIAVGVGSRGIGGLPAVVKAVVGKLQQLGARPFIVPAMGSHGGATPAGQRSMLAEFGVTEESMGVPIDDTMDVDRIGEAEGGIAAYCAKSVLASDGVIIINRIKPHTDFGGPLGSGLMKMLVIGLGKHAGALAAHRAVAYLGHEKVIRAVSKVTLQKAPFMGGVALVENAHHELACVEVVAPADLETREISLQAEARAGMARLPFEDLDLLIVDRIGKNISGAGMDPNVVGRDGQGYSSSLAVRPSYSPFIRRIFVRDLDPASHGNASGVGLADFTTDRLVRDMDRHSSFVNALTSMAPQSVKIPIHFPTDAEVLRAALDSLALADPSRARVARIKDTLSLGAMEVSESRLLPGLELVHPPVPLRFDGKGDLLPLGE